MGNFFAVYISLSVTSFKASALVACFQSGPASLLAEDISANSNGPRQDSLFDDDPEDLFAGTRAHTHTHTLTEVMQVIHLKLK